MSKDRVHNVNMDYTTVTEASGNRITREALSMVYTRYRYAAQYCDGKDVLEVACGAGQGLGYLAKRAKLVVGGDYTAALIAKARWHYGRRVPLLRFDAHTLPFRAASFDVVLLYEAIYYLAQPVKFLEECRQVLRKNGVLLLCTDNREWQDFNPSPFSTRYFSARELSALFWQCRFGAELYGAFPVSKESANDHIISFLKRTAVALHLIPKTMAGKEILKWLFLGPLCRLPPEVHDVMASYCPPVPIAIDRPIPNFKVLFVVARAC